jgi:hypothetical protein
MTRHAVHPAPGYATLPVGTRTDPVPPGARINPDHIQTTERYLGSKQKIRDAVNDRIGIEPAE